MAATLLNPKRMARFDFLVFLPIVFGSSLNAQSKNDMLLGRWAFQKFMAHDNTVAAYKFISDADKANKGMVITFRIDNKMMSNQPNGIKENNSVVPYKLLKDNLHLVMGSDTARIDVLNPTVLVLSMEGRPTIYFKRLK
ncbi:MAG: hypothetical protein IM562_05515 [Chitinophagaceae bacterium]|nr:hypothetical protein [Chitinophagaceae bacterium]MCA6446602.1 hypothetical protein [Chitinophagaceae bacterium]